MKRTILAVVIAVMVVTPCLAQKVEADEQFSIEETMWAVYGISNGLSTRSKQMGFYQGRVYELGSVSIFWLSPSYLNYIDTPVLSIAYNTDLRRWGRDRYVMLPIGFGVYREVRYSPKFGLRFEIGIMFKEDDDWSPYDQSIRCYNSDQCPDDMVCVDYPSYECDPNLDGYDCPGLCVNE